MNIEWTCDTCHQPTNGLGAISIAYDEIHRADDIRRTTDFTRLTPSDVLAQPNLGRWKVECDTCAGECTGAYWIDLRQVRNDADLADWTRHLSYKTWFTATNWNALVAAVTATQQARTAA